MKGISARHIKNPSQSGETFFTPDFIEVVIPSMKLGLYTKLRGKLFNSLLIFSAS